MRSLQMDLIQNLPETKEGYEHILVIIDMFTRFIGLYSIKDLPAITAARCILKHSGRYEFPDQIVSDNGLQFVIETIE